MSSSSDAISKPTRKATVDELRGGLERLGLDTKGKKETLWRRLLNAFNRSVQGTPPVPDPSESVDTEPAKVPSQPYKSFLCFDVEATCEGGKTFEYPNEIIEFPVVLLQWIEEDLESGKRGLRLVKVDTFHTYVKPTWRPRLSRFCMDLTGISQEQIDQSPTFPEVLIKLETWMDKWGLRDGDKLKDALWVTDGIPKQLHITPTSPPRYPLYLLGPYLNIKQATQSVLSEIYRREQYQINIPNEPHSPLGRITTSKLPTRRFKDDPPKLSTPQYYFTIAGQVEAFGLGDFDGRQHSGLDDATNISRILIAISERDVIIDANARLTSAKNAKTWPWMGARGEIIWDTPQPALVEVEYRKVEEGEEERPGEEGDERELKKEEVVTKEEDSPTWEENSGKVEGEEGGESSKA
ncbi:hypothetical protein P7C73_g1379, partial [Tremellales sp. Uapishka_1]